MRLLGDDRPRTLRPPPASGPRRRRARTPRSRWPGRCSARARTSPPRWPSRSPDEPGHRARHHPGVAARVAVHRRRVRRRPDHDRRASRSLSGSSSASSSSTRPAHRPTGRRWLDGGPRRDGHVGPEARAARGPAAQPRGLHLGQPHLRDGVGGGHPRHRDRPADRRAVAAWVPDSFWQALFLTDHPLLAKIWGRSSARSSRSSSFVCSIGNVPLAGVLWNGGISFGGVVSFMFADLIIIADPGHLPEVLRDPDDADAARRLLRARWCWPATWSRCCSAHSGWSPTERDAKVMDRGHHLELHDLAQHRLPGARRVACWSGSSAPAVVRCSR